MKRLPTVFMVIGLVVMVFAGSENNVLANADNSKRDNKVLSIAHRGAAGYAPENTMAAFEKAFEMKAEMLELDVQMSKDGELVVMHDTTVDRTTDGAGKVKNLTYDELKRLDAGSYFSKEFAGEKIPKLEEVLDEYRGKMGIVIEMKSPSLYPGIEQKIADTLKERNLDTPTNNDIIVQSFDHESLKAFHSILPEVPVAVLLDFNPDGVSDQQLTEFSSFAKYVNPNKTMIDKKLVERIHKYGMETYPWDVRERESVKALIKAGVDGVITIYPDYVGKHQKKE
ncbi:glycerophosphodiester phosphodiesterase [Halobacillus mangrovi]|uniref:Glycerophosphodiester phosphodiesterase n=1 Tax=Halobacillus mangrovi TaxID=402384 RepID=A0A1W5ZZE0_9BACI|nr:glycerophosphodiester phosphodiesterase family protein [Halobacillus mangrovi]ARI78629.1 glycerophosphodiester phosphodiesterase [Halobacillus mangrovi]